MTVRGVFGDAYELDGVTIIPVARVVGGAGGGGGGGFSRGGGGGFTLARDAEEISLLEVVEAIDGPLVTISDRPGLGVDVDWQIVREHPLA